jgi:hypothetical protein
MAADRTASAGQDVKGQESAAVHSTASRRIAMGGNGRSASEGAGLRGNAQECAGSAGQDCSGRQWRAGRRLRGEGKQRSGRIAAQQKAAHKAAFAFDETLVIRHSLYANAALVEVPTIFFRE